MQMKPILCTHNRILFILIVVGVSVLYYDIICRYTYLRRAHYYAFIFNIALLFSTRESFTACE